MIFTSGLPETTCGKGSTWAEAAAFAERLPVLLRTLGVHSMVDAPCGDMNWISRVDLADIHYTGIEVDPVRIKAAEENVARFGFAPASLTLLCRDMISEPIPKSDVVLCRDFLQHLTDAMVWSMLRNFAASQTPWLLATTHGSVRVNTEIDVVGGFRPLNLLVKPFCFWPMGMVEDPPASGRLVGLWARSDVEDALRRQVSAPN